MTTTAKRIVILAVLYWLAGALLTLSWYFEPWVAVGFVPVVPLFAYHAVQLYKERKSAKRLSGAA